MTMMPFYLVNRELAVNETRVITLTAPILQNRQLVLPVDEYGFTELYCTENGCDCRRVMINVFSRHAEAHVATISHGFEPPDDKDDYFGQTFLDPLNRQSSYSTALLDLFVSLLKSDESYRQRLERHYQIFKEAIADPAHPCQPYVRMLNGDEDTGPNVMRQLPKRSTRNQKKKRRR